jgi:uncharacterized protein
VLRWFGRHCRRNKCGSDTPIRSWKTWVSRDLPIPGSPPNRTTWPRALWASSHPVLDHIIDLGFDDVGLSALLVSPDPSLSFTATDFDRHLAYMIECGERAISQINAGRPYPFANLETALQEIHRGTHRPLPCGAGAGYLSVNAEGRIYACHRLIDDPNFAMGDVYTGTDIPARRHILDRSHVDLMQPCNRCWARYLCGGGCHHEVKARGRFGCDYIRGWLEFCLAAYVELSTRVLSPCQGWPRALRNLDPFSVSQSY